MEVFINIVITLLKLIFALSLITVIHEFGHFLMAKLLKIKVNEFSVGFGPKMFQYQGKETTYSLRWILLGGYNAIEGEGEESEDPSAFNNQPAWKRFIVLIMGSMFNILLAFILFVIVSMNLQLPSTKINSFIKYEFSKGSPVENAGMQVGDEILEVDGKKVSIYSDIKQENIKNNQIKVKFRRNGEIKETVVKDLINKVGSIGIIIEQVENSTQNRIKFLEPGKPATESGLKAGDSITKVNGVSVYTIDEVVEEILKYPNKEIEIEYLRNGKEEIAKKVTAEAVDRFNLGFIPEPVETKGLSKFKYGIIYAKETFGAVLNSYKDLFTGKASVKQLSGIVGIGEVVSKTEGFVDLFNLIAIISLSIGIMNLLPIPPMDGGKIFLLLIEVITRKKISIKTEAIISYIFVALLLILTLVVTVNDVTRIF